MNRHNDCLDEKERFSNGIYICKDSIDLLRRVAVKDRLFWQLVHFHHKEAQRIMNTMSAGGVAKIATLGGKTRYGQEGGGNKGVGPGGN